MPSGPGVITESLIEEISTNIPEDIFTFLLTSKITTKEIIEQQKRCKTNVIQICDRLIDERGLECYFDFKKYIPQVKIVQVIHVGGEESVKEAVDISKYVDFILLDSGNQNLEIKELGGTGKVHNWDVSKKIVDSVGVPVFLAGGLNETNVLGAINKVNPFGIDLCSSVRTNGLLDESKISNFFNKLQL
eukprot:TRINITY_DN4530_c0_g1_i2.p1 TRINITY_DN4530_c0_g1~~TRINITY_DN4530_c0_g1_i2.p1  ORF type:complete len:189 (+),score=37.14 TRINITY_DN4530_c0_g1_i2:280-846(+)